MLFFLYSLLLLSFSWESLLLLFIFCFGSLAPQIMEIGKNGRTDPYLKQKESVVRKLYPEGLADNLGVALSPVPSWLPWCLSH